MLFHMGQPIDCIFCQSTPHSAFFYPNDFFWFQDNIFFISALSSSLLILFLISSHHSPLLPHTTPHLTTMTTAANTTVWDTKTQQFHGGQDWKFLNNFVEDFSVTTNCLGTPVKAIQAARDAVSGGRLNSHMHDRSKLDGAHPCREAKKNTVQSLIDSRECFLNKRKYIGRHLPPLPPCQPGASKVLFGRMDLAQALGEQQRPSPSW